ncbi:MAG TPA: hypothetical protein VKS60_03880 [Stellaceae bacterium]|nr:hypothetical protein [Stellaceae bacterium]
MSGQQPRSARFHSVAAALVGVLIVAAIHVVLLYAARVQTSETPKLISEWNSEPANNVIYVMQPPPEIDRRKKAP